MLTAERTEVEASRLKEALLAGLVAEALGLALDLEAPPGPPGGVLADPDSGCRDGGVR